MHTMFMLSSELNYLEKQASPFHADYIPEEIIPQRNGMMNPYKTRKLLYRGEETHFEGYKDAFCID